MNFVIHIDDLVKNNSFFRQEIVTAGHSQVVIMNLEPREDIGLETHKVDQILIIKQGSGKAILNGKEYPISTGDLIMVPSGTQHNIINGNTKELKLLTIYAPAEHKPGTMHKTKQEALEE